MDEYTFLAVAKLQADRRRLEREQRAMLLQPEQPESRNKRPEYFGRKRNLVRALQWREQS
ncbi:MAG TPA: hypothetical protein VHK24_08600 [Steroidobacter sp.]|nr:hypothetical protein [Steroidobacter sp.]